MRRPASESARMAPSAVKSSKATIAEKSSLASISCDVSRKPPSKPQDLLDHRLLSFSQLKPDSRWIFVNRNSKATETLTFDPYLAMNDFAGIVPALLAGGGIGELPPVVQPDLIRSGQLVEVMPDWHFRTFDLSLVHLGRRHVSKPCRLFKEFSAQMAPILFPDLPT